jgi:hypothetical protein
VLYELILADQRLQVLGFIPRLGSPRLGSSVRNISQSVKKQQQAKLGPNTIRPTIRGLLTINVKG